jgi:hypothetical protein
MHSSGDEFKVASLVIFSCRWGFVSPLSEKVVAGHVDLLQETAVLSTLAAPAGKTSSTEFPPPEGEALRTLRKASADRARSFQRLGFYVSN